MAQSQLNVLITASAGQLRTELQTAKQGLDGVAKGGSAASSAFGLLTKAAGMLGVSFGAMQLARTVGQLYELGAAVGRATYALNAMTYGQADRYMEAVADATGHTISNLDMARVTASTLAFGLAETSDEAAEFVRVASILGGTFQGIGAADAAQQFALLMTNMSYRRLDTFGLSSAAVRQRVNELREETAGLTQEMAFNQAVMEQAAIRAGQLGDVYGDAAGTSNRLSAASENLRTAIGRSVTRAFAPLAESLAGIIDAQAILADIAADSDDVFDQYGYTMAELNNTTEEYTARTEQLNEAYRQGAVYLAQLNRVSGEDFELAQRQYRLDQLRSSQYSRLMTDRTAAEDAATQASDAAAAAAEAERDRVDALNDAYETRYDLLQGLAGIYADIQDVYADTWNEQERMQAVGEGFFDLLETTGQDALLGQGLAYDALRERYGLATREQLGFEHGLEAIGVMLEVHPTWIGQAADMYDRLVSGELASAEAVEREVAALERWQSIREISRGIERAPEGPAPLEYLAGAETEEAMAQISLALQDQSEAVGQMATDAMVFSDMGNSMLSNEVPLANWTTNLTTQREALETMRTTAPETFSAIGAGAGALTQEGSGWAAFATSVHATYGNIRNMRTELEQLSGVTVSVNRGVPAPPRQFGGPVTGGRPYIVGEAGPEMFVPATSGTIVPNAGRSMTIVNNIYGVLDDTMGARVIDMINRAMRDAGMVDLSVLGRAT